MMAESDKLPSPAEAVVPAIADSLKTMSQELLRPTRPAGLPDNHGQHGAGC